MSVHLVEWFSMGEEQFDVRGGQSFQLADVSCHIKASYAGRLFCDSVSNGTQVTDVLLFKHTILPGQITLAEDDGEALLCNEDTDELMEPENVLQRMALVDKVTGELSVFNFDAADSSLRFNSSHDRTLIAHET